MGLRTVVCVYDCQVADSMRIVIAAQSGYDWCCFLFVSLKVLNAR